MSKQERVGVFGVTGYAGRELVRLLSRHPGLEVAFATGKGYLDHETGLDREARAYFLCLPHGVSARFADSLRERHPDSVVVDLSGDLRLSSEEEYGRWYGEKHPAPRLLGAAPYGLTEVYRQAIAGARLVANPGCYATSVLLPLVPLVKAGVIDTSAIVVDSKSGASGAGRTLKENLLFCEVSDELSAYAPGHTHRHVGEIEGILGGQGRGPVEITFSPHLLPVKRGILSACYLRTQTPTAELSHVLAEAYSSCPFVRIVPEPPHLSDVVFTNRCHISLHPGARGWVVVFSALDNLVKGAAGQALQNLNVALGWDETLGLVPGAFE